MNSFFCSGYIFLEPSGWNEKVRVTLRAIQDVFCYFFYNKSNLNIFVLYHIYRFLSDLFQCGQHLTVENLSLFHHLGLVNQLEISFPYISFYCSPVIVLCHSMENDALWCLVELCYCGMIVTLHLHLVLNFYFHQLGCHYWYTNLLESFFPFFCSISLFGMAFSAPDIERWDKNFPCIVHG